MDSNPGEVAVQLQDDLARKYERHKDTIQSAWRSFSPAQRTKCMKAGAADGAVLKHPEDRSLGSVCKFIPEWNIRDISTSPDFFLDILHFRASFSLGDQYRAGIPGTPGDFDFINKKMQTKNLQHIKEFKDCFTFFSDDENYGKSYQITGEARVASVFKMAINSGVCIPQAVGELILQRQITFLQCLNIIIEDILEEAGQNTRQKKKKRSKKSEKEVAAELSKLSIESPVVKPTLENLIATAQEQKVSLQEYQDLLTVEPVVLAYAVNITFFSRPELVSDERGRMLPTAHTDKHISSAFFDAMLDAVKGAAVWTYLTHLLVLLDNFKSEKAYQSLILQELSNICHMEYGRAQAFFKRHVQTATGSKWFKRVSNIYDKAGNARVSMKANPEDLTRSDPQLHYMLRLCQIETTAPKALDWVLKLGQLHTAHPLEREKLQEREAHSLSELAVITGFVNDLSSAIPMPSFSRKKNQLFLSKWEELDVEMSVLKKEIDLRDFAVPIDNLLEPGIAEAALKVIDQFIIEKAGTKLGFLYQDLVDNSISGLQAEYEEAKIAQKQNANTEFIPIVSTPDQPEQRVEQQKQKEKTRPSHSSVYEIVPQSKTSNEEHPILLQTLKVDKSAAEVFSAIFAKSESRGSVAWSSFELAMGNLGFSILPKYGSVYTFCPPETMEVKRSFTVHRPHQSRIEGHLIPIFARRLKRTYGWSKNTFEV